MLENLPKELDFEAGRSQEQKKRKLQLRIALQKELMRRVEINAESGGGDDAKVLEWITEHSDKIKQLLDLDNNPKEASEIWRLLEEDFDSAVDRVEQLLKEMPIGRAA